MAITERGLGRIYQPDSRDATYRLADLLPPYPQTTGKKLWQVGPTLNQLDTPHCVGFAWRDWLDAAPVSELATVPPDADTIYARANASDGDPAPHDGTSVRAGAKVIQSLGLIQSYHWAQSYRDVTLYLLNVAPVVLGTNWYERMFNPSKTGRVTIGGAVAGGHAYLAVGVDTGKHLVTCLNSWGSEWGNAGLFTMSFATLDRLLREQGEACAALGKH
jgi:hypothetical protein